jgi:hypothetical protein
VAAGQQRVVTARHREWRIESFDVNDGHSSRAAVFCLSQIIKLIRPKLLHSFYF